MTNQPEVITGRIGDRPIAELLQSLHQERKTGVARFRTALGSATVWFRDGELVDADMGRFHMEAAVLRLLKIQDGEFEVELSAISRRRVIKSSTAQLLAEGRQRAPRPGPQRLVPPKQAQPLPSGKPVSGGYSHIGTGVRDDSRPRRRARRPTNEGLTGATERSPARPPRGQSDTTAHTAVRSKPAAPADTDAHTVVGAKKSPAVAEAAAATDPASPPAKGRGPSRRRGHVASWHPTAGGKGQSDSNPEMSATPPATPAPTPAPLAAAASPDEVIEPSSRGRTRFMFGVAGPAARPPSTSAPKAPSPPPEPEPAAEAVSDDSRTRAFETVADEVSDASETMTFGSVPDRSQTKAFGGAPAPTPSPPPPATPATPAAARRPPSSKPPGARSPSEPRRRRRSQPRQTSPFEAESVDKTLMRVGPIPPPPGTQSGPIPITSSGAAAVSGSATSTPSEVVTTEVLPPKVDRAPAIYSQQPIVDEEYSHPIAVPTAPSVGPGGTWMLGPDGQSGFEAPSRDDKPLPPDPSAEATIVIRSSEVVARAADAASKSGGTAHVGRYEVLLRLARGGMGTVYLCRVTGEGGFRRLFALKVIRDHLNTNHAYVQMLLEEARIASRLNHPNIVSIIDIDTFAGQHYLVMDYVEGCTFSELIKAHPKARPPELVIPVVLDALTGLHAAHSMRGDDGSLQPVVHCDFSPQNMLVGVNGTCRITDFGISKATDALQQGPGRGKPGYISPEQVRGLPLDPRSDIFSAGVVLWNALTGEQLFDGDSAELILHQVVSRKVPKPSTVGLRPPACFDRICLKALERDPERRYQSAEQMMTELRKVAIANDLLAPSSEIGRWVQETFGAQIELRRQTAGLQPSVPASGVALREVGPTGHPDGAPRDGSVTGLDPNASQTMMIQGGAAADMLAEDDEGFGARTRVVVLVAALAFAAAAVVTLFVRPDLLQGGMLNEHGEYVELGEVDPLERRRQAGSTGGLDAGDGSTGGLVAADTGGTDTEGETDTDTEGETDTEDTGEAVPVEAPPKGKGGKGKGGKGKGGKGKGGKGKGKGDDADAESGKGGKGKGGKGKGGKGKADDTEPPPDLGELFKPPGG